MGRCGRFYTLALESANIVCDEVILDSFQKAFPARGDGSRNRLCVPGLNGGVERNRPIVININECLHVTVARHLFRNAIVFSPSRSHAAAAGAR